jgi:hypothetical protein
MELQPTQLTTLLGIGNILHAYVRQNNVMMATNLAVYTTSLLYHFTKFDYPLHLRTRRPIFTYDIIACIFLFLGGFYEGHTTYIPPNYYKVLLALHLFNPFFFIGTSYFKVAVWSENPDTAERWHAAYHIFTQLQVHLFLSVYKKY